MRGILVCIVLILFSHVVFALEGITGADVIFVTPIESDIVVYPLNIFDAQYTVVIRDTNGNIIAESPISPNIQLPDYVDLEFNDFPSRLYNGVVLNDVSAKDAVQDVLIISDIPENSSSFTRFEYLTGVSPTAADFSTVNLRTGHVCGREEFGVYKCTNWNPITNVCNDEGSWVRIQTLEPGVQEINITLTKHDPGLGIGPNPTGAYCGDAICQAEESCSTCQNDCCTIPVTQLGCQENWLCSDWSQYNEAGFRTRSCQDINDCSSTVRKPIERQDCISPVDKMIEKVEPIRLTQQKSGSSKALILTILLIISVLVNILQLMFRR